MGCFFEEKHLASYPGEKRFWPVIFFVRRDWAQDGSVKKTLPEYHFRSS